MNPENAGRPPETASEDAYRGCCLYEKNVCGPRKNRRVLVEGLIDLAELEKLPVVSYLRDNLHSRDHKLFSQWNEKLLIENRVGYCLDPENKICPYHRFAKGTMWYAKQQCAIHTAHKEVKSGQKCGKTFPITLSTITELNKANPFSYVLGSQVCKFHLKSLNAESRSETPQVEPTCSLNDSVSTAANESMQADDEPYEPPVLALTPHSDRNFKMVQDLCSTFSVTPVKTRVGVTKPMSELSTSRVGYFKRKRDEFLSGAAALFDRTVAAGQPAEEIQKALNIQPENVSDDLYPLVQSYSESDSFGKMTILSLINHEKYSKTELMEIFGCSRWKIDQARAMKMQNKGVTAKEKVPFKRNRLNTEKSEHFLDFLFSSGLLQDVAYGVSKLRFDNGETQVLPNAILQNKYSHTIQFYNDVCKEIGYTPLSSSSLLRILNALKPSQRKSLAGLDDITAEGMNGFQFLHQVIVDLKLGKEVADKLERAKRYLKMYYQGHCSISSKIATHNTAYALSYPKELQCSEVGEEVCMDCYNIFEVLSFLSGVASENGNADLIYDVDLSVKNIIKYMKHQIRDEQQKQAKIYCFEQVSQEVAFWLRDYSQKVLPRSYREGQKSYYGKKGMSMHIDIFYTKQPDDELLKQVYYTLVYRSDQSKLDTMNIASCVLSQFSKDFPEVHSVNGKSDNAGSYHGNQILENLYHLCKSTGLTLLRYDYNEPCRGKDQCDRESSGAKSLINSYVESGNDLLTTMDVFHALHHGKGASNAKVGIVEIDSSLSTMSGQDITGINSYHSAEFLSDRMKLYRYYGIGEGKVVKYADAKFEASLSVTTEFSKPCNESKKQKKRTTVSKNLLFCPTPSCSSVFENQEEFEEHMLSEKHTFVKETSSMDKVKSSFVKRMKVTSAAHQVCSTTAIELSEHSIESAKLSAPLFAEVTKQGWAIPTIATFRYSFDQKKFLYDIFMTGQETGKKKSPEEVELLVRKNFASPKDYVTKSQIRALFSNFTKQLKDGTLEDPAEKLKKNPSTEVAVDPVVVDDDELIQEELEDIAEDVIARVSTWEVGSFVVTRNRRSWLPGRIIPNDTDREIDEEYFLVECMEKKSGKNIFRWPASRKVKELHVTDLLIEIDEVTPLNGGKCRSDEDIIWCSLSDTDARDANLALKKALREY